MNHLTYGHSYLQVVFSSVLPCMDKLTANPASYVHNMTAGRQERIWNPSGAAPYQ